jgi:hypothetical protein
VFQIGRVRPQFPVERLRSPGTLASILLSTLVRRHITGSDGGILWPRVVWSAPQAILPAAGGARLCWLPFKGRIGNEVFFEWLERAENLVVVFFLTVTALGTIPHL